MEVRAGVLVNGVPFGALVVVVGGYNMNNVRVLGRENCAVEDRNSEVELQSDRHAPPHPRFKPRAYLIDPASIIGTTVEHDADTGGRNHHPSRVGGPPSLERVRQFGRLLGNIATGAGIGSRRPKSSWPTPRHRAAAVDMRGVYGDKMWYARTDGPTVDVRVTLSMDVFFWNYCGLASNLSDPEPDVGVCFWERKL
ncbi:hypothetical protein C8J57DRAFT_1238052 [Mycena rebaudengoi]|nr:hypothetical protein C8J57DRAFT_1238052 [Mycena rebaudengoi]